MQLPRPHRTGAPAHPKTLPFTYTRAENGAPIIELLTKTRYFGFVQQRFWYSVWWTGVDVVKQNDTVFVPTDGLAHFINVGISSLDDADTTAGTRGCARGCPVY